MKIPIQTCFGAKVTTAALQAQARSSPYRPEQTELVENHLGCIVFTVPGLGEEPRRGWRLLTRLMAGLNWWAEGDPNSDVTTSTRVQACRNVHALLRMRIKSLSNTHLV